MVGRRMVTDVKTLERLRRYAMKNDLEFGALLAIALKEGVPRDYGSRVSRVLLNFRVTRASVVDEEISVGAESG